MLVFCVHSQREILRDAGPAGPRVERQVSRGGPAQRDEDGGANGGQPGLSQKQDVHRTNSGPKLL